MNLPKRRPARLKGYDYSSAGAYFITVCSHNRKLLFSNIVGEIHESPENVLTRYGAIVKETIEILPERFNVSVSNYVIMPNHIHMLIDIPSENGRFVNRPYGRERSLTDMLVGFMKMNVSKRIHALGADIAVWQRSYHDHIIRNENDYENIWRYIDSNVLLWKKDCFYKKSSQ